MTVMPGPGAGSKLLCLGGFTLSLASAAAFEA